MLRRRSFLTGIVAALAAPAIIRTPGLIMPVKPARFETRGMTVVGRELWGQYANAIDDWQSMWNGPPGLVGGFNFEGTNVSKAMLALGRMQELEAQIAKVTRVDQLTKNGTMTLEAAYRRSQGVRAYPDLSWEAHWRELNERGIT